MKAKLNVYTDPAISEPPPLPSGTSSPATLASTGGSKTAESGNAATQETDAGQKESAAAALRGQAHAVPDEFSLGANYPNPFRTSTQIRFGLPKEAAGQVGSLRPAGPSCGRAGKRKNAGGLSPRASQRRGALQRRLRLPPRRGLGGIHRHRAHGAGEVKRRERRAHDEERASSKRRWICSKRSPPKRSSSALATTSATVASATVEAAGTLVTSERS